MPTTLAEFQGVYSNAIKDNTRGRASGGLGIYMKKWIKFVELESSPWWTFIQVPTLDLIIGLVYLKPSLNISYILELLQEIVSDLRDKFCNCKLVIGGDFNSRIGAYDVLDEEICTGLGLQFPHDSLDKIMCGESPG